MTTLKPLAYVEYKFKSSCSPCSSFDKTFLKDSTDPELLFDKNDLDLFEPISGFEFFRDKVLGNDLLLLVNGCVNLDVTFDAVNLGCLFILSDPELMIGGLLNSSLAEFNEELIELFEAVVDLVFLIGALGKAACLIIGVVNSF
ncbi:hypothetical protein WICMUC_001779 [Wickerhamomyces mucosus]|uniref:Uncharacterized protein n=1 Tax=Wickerhamomyces mucosus TaxID=1378264 RepID=A0A9P8PRX1_9ASCO|nr:hypothetical protein WICMUC_001779 [Wickerhamomyces mucosus]